jgi:membrane fusion protein (multidrug efflux system)
MAKKIVYPLVAILGIAVASGAAWWYQSKPTGPKEMVAGSGAAPAGAPAGPASGPAVPRAAGVEVAKVETMSLRDDAQAVGTLRSRQSVMLRPEIAGRIKELGFTDGARVRKGQMLVQLDDALQRADLRQALAQVSIAKANLKRNEELVAQNFVAKRVLDESAASLQVAEAQLGLSCARLSRMVLLAPFDGTLGIRNINLGDFVKDGADLVNLEDTSSMYVDFRLPERFQGKLKLQQPVELLLDAVPGRKFKARIEALDPLLDANGRSVGVRAVLPNSMGEAATPPGAAGGGRPAAAAAAAAAASAPKARPARPAAARPNAAPESGTVSRAAGPYEALGCPPDPITPSARPAMPAAAAGRAAPAGGPAPLRPGMFARVTAVFSVNEAALVVPEEAIVPQGGRQFVFKVVEPSALPPAVAASAPPLAPDTKFVSQRQEVKLGARRAGKVEVTDGLSEGQTVVVAGQQRLQRDGTALRVVELGRPPQAGAPGAGASPPGATASAATPAASR